MKKSSRFFWIFILLLSLGLAWYAVTSHNTSPPSKPADGGVPAAQTQQAVENLTINFGSQLQKVSLMAPTATAAAAISSTYAGYASPDLIATWMANPTKAPGRLTSSPWPDHILIMSVATSTNGGYSIQGNVVEVTSAGYADEYPVSLGITQVNGQWLITSYNDGLKRP